MRKLLLATAAVLGTSIGMAGLAHAQSSPAPGTVTVRLNGRVNFYAAVTGSTGDNVNGNKLARDGFQGYFRLFPGFDGVAANGLHYGAAAEIRQNGGSAGNGTSSGTETLFVHQAYGYFGTPQFGTVRFGQTVGPLTLFETGIMAGFNDGGWDGDVPGFVPGNVQPAYPWPDVGVEEETNKIVYLSPNFAGFDVGLSYAPSTAGFNVGQGACAVASNACDRLSSSATLGADARPRNLYEVVLRYKGNLGPMGVTATAGYGGSGRVSSPGQQFRNLAYGDFGLELTYGGILVGGHVSGGRFNNSFGNLEPVGAKDAIAWTAGAQYTTGPVVFGASYYNFQHQGDFSSPATEGQAVDVGIAAGGTYTLAPGVSVFLSYLYGTHKQGGFDSIAQAPGPLHNYVQSQLIAIGTQLSW